MNRIKEEMGALRTAPPDERPATVIPAEFVKKMAPQQKPNQYPNWFWASSFGARKESKKEAGAWPGGSLPHGWTDKSLTSYWNTITGGAEDKITTCMNKVDPKAAPNPGAFCGGLAHLVGYKPAKHKQKETTVSTGFPQMLRPKTK